MHTVNQNPTLMAAVRHYGDLFMIETGQARKYLAMAASMDAEAHRAAMEDSKAEWNGQCLVQDGVAILSLNGFMSREPNSIGGTSTTMLRRSIRAAVSDDSVKAILMIVNSGGGTVDGTAALADDIAAAARKKPFYSYVEGTCASAAFWAASQGTQILADRTAEQGSIGTLFVVEDWSKFYEDLGVKVHALATGPIKGAGVEGTEITEEQLKAFETRRDDLNAHFLAGVAKGRKLSADDVKAVADGSVWISKKAQSLGLIDGISTYDQAFLACKAAGEGSKKSMQSAAVTTGHGTHAMEPVTVVIPSQDEGSVDSPKTEEQPSALVTHKQFFSDGPIGMSLDDHGEAVCQAVEHYFARYQERAEARNADGTLNQAFINRLRESAAKLAALIPEEPETRNVEDPEATTRSLDWEQSRHNASLRAQRLGVAS